MRLLHFSPTLGLYLALAAADLLSGPVPVNKPAHYPDWWFERDVITRLPAHATNPAPIWPDHYPTADDYAAANIGQLKNIASKAAIELDYIIPGGAGASVQIMLSSWSGGAEDDYALINIGQLKEVARHFYVRLLQSGYMGAPHYTWIQYPWSQTDSDDDSYAVVNLGQMKYIFGFFATGFILDSYMADNDLDGIPSGWEIENGLNPLNPTDAAITNGGVTNLQVYQQSIDTGTGPSTQTAVGLLVYSP